MSDVVFQICDCCGRYCVHRSESGRLVSEPTARFMVDGLVMHVCESCVSKPIASLLEKRKLIAEQNAGLVEHRGAGCG